MRWISGLVGFGSESLGWLPPRAKLSPHLDPFRISMLNESRSHRVTHSIGHAGASRKSLDEVPWEMLRRRLSEGKVNFCKPQTLVRIPAGYLHTPDTGQDTCGVPAYPWHWSGYLRGTCIPLTLVRIPAGYLQTPNSGQDMKEEVDKIAGWLNWARARSFL